MKKLIATFDGETGNKFVGYYKTVRGYVREQLVQKTLDNHLPVLPARIIDIGGDDGIDAPG